MQQNKYSWNKTLKFSWGHIVAFISLIFISYVTYMGAFYQNGGDFVFAALKVGLLDTSLLVTFIGAQILKGTDDKFDRYLIFERILIMLTPVTFVLAMMPYNHFWNVYGKSEMIEQQFTSAINGTKAMFNDYETYAHSRIASYKTALETDGKDPIARENQLHTLELQLLSINYTTLKEQATKWIDEADRETSVWNAFLIGNVRQIEEAIRSWHTVLCSHSEPRLSSEPEGEAFDGSGESIKTAVEGLHKLTELYKDSSEVSPITLVSGLFLFLMLLFPYLLQSRNAKTLGIYSLIPMRRKTSFTLSNNSRPRGKNNHAARYDKPDNNNDIYSGTL